MDEEKPAAVLGIDAGGSSSRWLLLDLSGRPLAQGRGGPLTGHLFTPKDQEENFLRLRGLLQEALAVARPVALVAGVTGLHQGAEAERLMTQEVARLLGLEPGSVKLDNDLHIAYASAFRPGEGVLVYAGTGSVGYHETAAGEVVRAGGYGYLIDDYGAGYWIGHQGLRQTFRWLDELGYPAAYPLAQAIYTALGSDDWDAIIEVVYGGGRSRVAALAPAVAEAAREGDEAAVNILKQAGQELARLARAVLGRLEKPLPVAFAGGVTRMSPLIAEALQSELPPGSSFNVVDIEPVEAAARLALELCKAEVRSE